MSDIERTILEESRRFRAVLPSLLASHRGQWVVFRDGRPRGFHATEDEALEDALDQFGIDGGFVVAPVEDEEPIVLSAAAFLRPPS